MRALAVLVLVGCQGPAPLSHEAYVWQRSWTGAVEASVRDAPPELAGLRVLALEVEADRRVEPDVDLGALAGRRVTAVIRLDGARLLPEVDPGALVARWRAAGVDVVGIEIDHDCATAALGDYATWLERLHPGVPLSITALPTWMESPDDLARVLGAVDDVVLQVHAVHAPELFDPDEARAWVEAFPARRFRVALPTYSVVVDGFDTRRAAQPRGDGTIVRRSDPEEIAAFVRDLERRPVRGLRGVVWFRLPVGGDRAAWSAPTLRAVIGGAPLAAAVDASLVERGAGRFDVVVENHGSLDGAYPEIALAGAALDLVGGYRAVDGRFVAPGRVVRPGERIVVGWVTGSEVSLDAW